MIEGSDGFLYGTTCWGGQNGDRHEPEPGLTGQGTMFSVSRDGSSFQSIHSFMDSANVHDGSCPTAGLVQGSDGMLYGTTSAGRRGRQHYHPAAVLFRLEHRRNAVSKFFTRSTSRDGVLSRSPRRFLHTNGIIYGMTTKGGIAGNVGNYGVLYSYDPG